MKHILRYYFYVSLYEVETCILHFINAVYFLTSWFWSRFF